MKLFLTLGVAMLSLCAEAASYSLPADIGRNPFGECSHGGGSVYRCSGNVSLGNNDQVVLTAPVQLEISGNFNAGNNVTLDNGGHSFTVITGGNFSVGNRFSGQLDIRASGNLSFGNSPSVSGQLHAGGNVSLGNSTDVTGNITAGGNLSISGGRVNGICTPHHALCSGVDPTPQELCAVDSFASGTLNPALWNAMAVSGSYVPTVVDVGGSKRLRLTSAATNQSTMVQLKKWFPAAKNRVTIEFDYHVWGGSGADGVTVVFSDASIAPAAGGFGGSLGYAQRSGIKGFNGGWLGIGIDEFGNFPTTSEGRLGYPTGWVAPAGANVAVAQRKNNVSIRGSGQDAAGYFLLANTGTLSPVIWSRSNTSAAKQRFRIVIDNTQPGKAMVSVERDTSGTGNSFEHLIQPFDVFAANSLQAPIPENLLVSFTGSTGGSHNNHEISYANICALEMTDPAGAIDAAEFDCLETGSNLPWNPAARRPIYTKRVGTDFKLDVAALQSDGTLESRFVQAGGETRYLRLELVDDSVEPAPVCENYSQVLAAQTVSFASGTHSGAPGRALSHNLRVNSPQRKVRCRIRECTSSACSAFTAKPAVCSSDRFSVRPAAVTLHTSASAAPASPTAQPAIKAGAGFTLRATTSSGYSGSLLLDSGKLTAQNPSQSAVTGGGRVGTLNPLALVGNAPSATATYSEVGYLYLAPGAFRDETFTKVDADAGDCTTSTASDNNLSDALVGSTGKYGCHIGNRTAVSLGRFMPDHFDVVDPLFSPGCGSFTYLGQPFSLSATVEARNAVNQRTENYHQLYATGQIEVEMEEGNNGQALDVDMLQVPTPPVWSHGRSIFLANAIERPAALVAGYPALEIGLKLDAEAALPANVRPYLRGRNMDASNTSCVSDAPSTSNGTCQATRIAGPTPFYFGRLRLSNTSGSETQDLQMRVRSEFWTGKSWVPSVDDNCTILPAASFFLTGDLAGNTAAAAVNLTNGLGTLRLSKPNPVATGSVDIAVNLGSSGVDQSCLATHGGTPAGLPWLRSRNGSCSTGYDRDPSARASFGIYSPESRKTVHVRELF